MSSKAKKLSDGVALHQCYYHKSMYNLYPGSVLVCYSIFERPSDKTKESIKKQWHKIMKNPSKYYKDGDDFYNPEYTLNIFGLKRTSDWKVAVFVGKTNTLLAPYEEIDGKVYPYPLREDGFAGPTLKHPVSVHVLNWGEDKDVADNMCSNL